MEENIVTTTDDNIKISLDDMYIGRNNIILNNIICKNKKIKTMPESIFDYMLQPILSPDNLIELEDLYTIYFDNSHISTQEITNNILRIIRNMKFINDILYNYCKEYNIMRFKSNVDKIDKENVNYLVQSGIDSLYMILMYIHVNKKSLDFDNEISLQPLYHVILQYVILSYRYEQEKISSYFDNERNDFSLEMAYKHTFKFSYIMKQIYKINDCKKLFLFFEKELQKRYNNESSDVSESVKEFNEKYLSLKENSLNSFLDFIDTSEEIIFFNTYIENIQCTYFNEIVEKITKNKDYNLVPTHIVTSDEFKDIVNNSSIAE